MKISKIIPNWFYKEPIPEITNEDLLETVNKIKKIKDSEEALKESLKIISNKYESKRFSTYALIHRIVEHNPNILWERSGFMHCNQQNFLLRVLMVKSGQIKDEDIMLAYSLIWYVSLHQYLVLKMNNKLVAADPWNYSSGATYGRYAVGFGTKTL